MRRLMGIVSAILVCGMFQAATAADWEGRSLSAYLDALNEQGLRIVYSNDLVDDSLLLLEEPDRADPQASLDNILRPHRLTFVAGPAGSLLIVRRDDEPGPATVEDRTAPPSAPLPEIVVTSSRHRLEYRQSGSHTYLDRELATRIPTLGDEAVRLTQRLPGSASGGVSARSHIRGGEANEVLFLLDGLRLYEPYHLKDFQTIATIVNSNAISGVDFFSGGYSARFGDSMSGVMSLNLREPEGSVETELSLSFFNASLLSLGSFGDEQQGDWLFAVRRGNLDLIADVIDPDFGSPDYQDYLFHLAWEFGPRTQFSGNLLASIDKIDLADADVGEQASARYENRVLWLKWNAAWTDSLQSEAIVSFSDIENRRLGSLDQPGIVSGNIDDEKGFRAFEFQQDWRFVASDEWMLSFGYSARDLEGDYRFSSRKALASPFDRILGNQPLTILDVSLSPNGTQYAVYGELRWQATPRLTADLGLRWDQQNYTTAKDDEQISPRVSLLYRISPNTEFRLGWGQFYQAQEINELQVSDGVTEYFPAQQAEHIVANFKHDFRSIVDIDITLYRKSFRELRPRFENVFNTLVFNPEIQFDRIRIDADSAEALGAELMLSRGGTDQKLLWWLGYAWSEVEDTVAASKFRRSWDQTNTVKAGISWRWGKWNLSAAGELHTGWPRTDLIAGTALNPDGSERLTLTTTQRNSSQYSINHTVDIRVSRDFDIARGDLTAFAEVTNVYDRANPCCIEYSRPGGANGTNLTSRQSHWLPLIPSLGIIWRF